MRQLIHVYRDSKTLDEPPKQVMNVSKDMSKAKRFKRCVRCGRVLTSPVSKSRGYGEECEQYLKADSSKPTLINPIKS